VVVEVVTTVNTSVPAPPATDEDARLQVAGLVAPLGPATAHVRPTAAVKPFNGATVMVDVLPAVAPAVRLMLPLLLSVKLGVAATLPPTTSCRPRV